MTLIFLAIFAAMATALAISSDTELLVARNRVESQQAAALAEAGLTMALMHMGGTVVPGTNDVLDLHQAIAQRFQQVWGGVWVTAETPIQCDSSSVVLPSVIVPGEEGQTRTIELEIAADGGAASAPRIEIKSTGRCGNAVRTVYYEMSTLQSMTVLSKYGIASKSPIQMKGNPTVRGANNNAEGSVLSATQVALEAIELTGSVTISGDVAVCNASATIDTKGKVTIGGDKIYGAAQPAWPTVDPNVFKPYATNVYNGTQGTTLTNIRIPAGTNPIFNNDMTLNGVIYIESPNVVKFNGKANVCGVIVTDKPATQNFSTNQVIFCGNVNATGVENLPAEPQFADIRTKTGTFLLAEGFNLKFTGSFNMTGGYIIGSNFEFSGNAGGLIRGGVINLGNNTFTVDGSVVLTIDKKNASQNPAGLVSPYFLVCVGGSYRDRPREN